MNPTQIDVQVKHSLFNPSFPQSDSSNRVHYRKEEDDTYYYRVFLFIDGPDLPYVDSVTYALDDSFPQPIQTVSRTPANPNCQLVIWTWKEGFTLVATITDKKNNNYQVTHELSYAEELPSEISQYKEVEAELKQSSRPTLVSA